MIPLEVRAVFNRVPQMSLATTSPGGVPNVVAIASQKIVGNTVWIIDTYFGKTKYNIVKTGRAAVAFWEGYEGFQIKGRAVYHEKGEIFEKAKAWSVSLKPNKQVKGVVELKAEEIFSLKPKPGEAGKQIYP